MPQFKNACSHWGVAVIVVVGLVIFLHKIVMERDTHVLSQPCSESNNHMCCEEWCESKRAAQKECFERGSCYNKQCYGGHDHHDEL